MSALADLSSDDRAAVESLLAKRRRVAPEMLASPAERERILAAFRQGCEPHAGVPDLLVNVQAHDVLALVQWIDALRAGQLPVNRNPPAPETTA